jgi:CRISPR-associated endonuclease/helicase Cas3
MQQQEELLTALLSRLGVGSPYAWQREAFRRLCGGDPPSQIKVPTAAGKTMIIPIFVAALAFQATTGRVTLPRRLVHVVNRRVLVDEAGSLGERIANAIDDAEELRPLREALASLSASGKALALATLRGGIEDNGAWGLDPSTPAVILATPDMLGSRLLFRGYGVGRSRGATHSGLLGCDTLVVHDESHLASAFTILLRQVETLAEPGARLIGRPPLRVIEMTATLSAGASARPLVCDVAADPALAARMSAPKRLRLIDARLEATKATKPMTAVLETISDHAVAEASRNRAVAIFVSSPGAADYIAGRLLKAGVQAERIVTLTGTMRGHERAALVASAAFRRFDPTDSRTEGATAYFIATSAGEIGLDIDADIGLFDLTTLDRFIQRSGRINRRGMTIGDIRLVHTSGEELPAALQQRGRASLTHLEALPLVNGTADVSPLALSRLCDSPDYPEATEPPPAVRMLEPAIVELLGMTSLRLDEQRSPSPDVFIHGLVEDTAELNLAWRDLPRPEADFTEWLDVWPLAPAELGKLPIEPARKLLRERLFAAQEAHAGVLAVALDSQGMPASTEPVLLPGMSVVRWVNRLRPGAIVLLSSGIGGLNPQGIPSATSSEAVADVSWGFTDANGLQRVQVQKLAVTCRIAEDGMEWWTAEASAPSLDRLLDAVSPGYEVVFHDGPRTLDGTGWTGTVTMWLTQRTIRSSDAGDLASLSGQDRLLDEHLDLTARAARRLSTRLGLAPAIASAEIRAAAEHDRGKAWERWQRAVGNTDRNRILGKSARSGFDYLVNDGYRHELGSVVDSGARLTLLERHLVASHHGWCRPGFRDAALAKPGCTQAALQVADGFAALNATLGPWALCYLEAVLKSADVLAEVLDVALAGDEAFTLPPASDFPRVESPMRTAFRLPVEVANFGEYLAGLGLASLLIHRGVAIAFGWVDGALVIEGAGPDEVLAALRSIRGAQVLPDEGATVDEQQESAYPPLKLRLAGGTDIALNHWLDERGAGQTTALGTLSSVARACSDSLDLPDFDAARIFTIGGRRVDADASKFRFDAATSWSARDAGFSLNESDGFKSTRPWVELLSALGLQYFFPPPADSDPSYFTWQGMLPPTLALAAVKGLLPQCDTGHRPVIEASGKMKDVFTSQPLFRERKSTCPAHIRVI